MSTVIDADVDQKQEPEGYDKISQDVVSSFKMAEDVVNEDGLDNPNSTGDDRYFRGIDDVMNYDENVIKPRDEYWDNNKDLRDAIIAQHDGDEKAAHDDFMAKYEEAQSLELENDVQKVEKVQLTAGWASRFTDDSWFEVGDFAPDIIEQYATLSGRKRLGDMWTAATSSIRDAQTKGIGYLDDKGDLIELKDSEEFADSWWGFGSSIMYNQNHKSSDGREVIGFEYVPADDYTRGPGSLKAIYQGDRPEGEIVSRFDLSDTWLRSNRMRRNAFLDIPMTLARSSIGLLTNTIIGGTEALRSAVTIFDDDNSFLDSTQTFNTVLKSFKISKTDEDMESLITWSNALDLTADVVGQIALAAATGGASVAAMGAMGIGVNSAKAMAMISAARMAGNAKKATAIIKGIRQGQKLTSTVAKINTAFVYGAIAGDGIKDEAIKAGYSERSASVLFLMYMAAVGKIGQSSNLMPHQFNSRVMNATGRSAFLEARVLKGATEFGSNKGTWSLAQRLVKSVNKNYRDVAVKMAENPGKGAMIMAGAEEMFEENLELAVEVALKHAWEASASITGQDPNKKGFLTIHDPEFWAQIPAEILMSTVAGFGGGMIGYKLPFTGSKIPPDALPFKGEDKMKLARLAYHSARGTEMGTRSEKAFYQQIKDALGTGELGSLKYTIDRDDKGNFKSKAENPDGMTIGDAVYNLILHQYHEMKVQFQGTQTEDFDMFLAENEEIKKDLEGGNYVLDKFQAENDKLNTLFKGVDPLLIFRDEKEKKSKKKRFGLFSKKDKSADKEETTSTTTEDKAEDRAEDRAEASETVEAGETATTEVEDSTSTDVTDSDTEESAVAAEEQEEQRIERLHENTEEAERLAGVLGISEADAHEILLIQDRLYDMANGLTVERDMKANYFRSIPELNVLVDDEEYKRKYGDDYADKILQADDKRMRLEIASWKEAEKPLQAAVKHINEATNLTQLMSMEHLLNEKGELMIRGPALEVFKSKFFAMLDKEATEAEIATAQLEIIEKFDLLDPRSERESKASPIEGRKNAVTVADELTQKLKQELADDKKENPSTFGKRKDDILRQFIDKNRTEIVKVVQTRYIASLNSLRRLNAGKLDTSGDSIVQYLRKEIDKKPSDDEITVNLDGYGGFNKMIKMSKVAPQALASYDKPLETTKVFDDSITLYKKGDIKKATDKLDALKVNTTIPPKPDEDIMAFLLRGLNSSNPNQLESTAENLFSKEFFHLVENEDGTETLEKSEDSFMFETDRDILSSLQKNVVHISDTVSIFHDLDAAKDLVRQLEIRKALVELYTGKYDTPGNAFMGKIAKLREYNAKTMARADYYSPIADEDYTAYSKYFSNYIVDPVDYRKYQEMALADFENGTSTLAGEELERFARMTARLKAMQNYLLPNIEGALIEARTLVEYAENLSDEAKLEAAYKSGVEDHRAAFTVQLENFIDERSEQLPEDISNALKDQLNKLEAVELTSSSKDEEIEAAYKLIQETASILYEIPDNVKVDILSMAENTDKTVRRDVYAFLLVDYKQFYSRLKNLDLGNPPSIKQDLAAFHAFGAIISKRKLSSGETSPAVLSEIEKRRDEELLLKTVNVSEQDKISNGLMTPYNKTTDKGVEKLSLLGMQWNEGYRAQVQESKDHTSEGFKGTPYRVVIKTIEVQINEDGKMISSAKVRIGQFDSKESADEWFKDEEAKTEPRRQKRIDSINKKYEDELLASSTKGEVEVPGLTDGYKYANVVFIDGAQGTGKTTMAMGMAVKIAQEYLDTNIEEESEDYLDFSEGDSPNKVLLATNNNTQLNLLNKQAEIAALNTKKIGVDGKGFLLKDLHALLDPDGDIDEAVATLKDVTIIVYDEATHIQANSDHIVESDLNTMSKGLDIINARREAAGMRAITWVTMGDRKQGGWVEGMPTATSEDSKIDYEELGTERNLGTVSERGHIYSTARLTYSFRSYVTEQDKVSTAFKQVWDQARGLSLDDKREEILSNWGPLENDGENPKLGGTDFAYNEDSLYTDEFAEHLNWQLDNDPNFTMVLVTENGDTPLRVGSKLEHLFMNPLYEGRLSIESIHTVQGSEYDYVLAILPDGFLKPIGARMTPAEAYNYRLAAMIVGRSRYFTRMIVSPRLNISSTRRDDMKKIDFDAKETFKKNWTAFREKLFSDLPSLDISTREKSSDEGEETEESTDDEGGGGSAEGDDGEVKTIIPKKRKKLKSKSKSADIKAGISVGETSFEMDERDIIQDAAYDHQLELIKKKYGLDDELTIEETLDILDKESEDMSLEEEQREASAEAREELIQLIEGSPIVEDEIDSTPEVTEEVTKLITGKTDPTEDFDEVIGKLSEEPDAMAKKLDEEGWGISYTFNALDEKVVGQSEANRRKYYYLVDILGGNYNGVPSNATSVNPDIMPPALIHRHTKRAAGLTTEANAMNQYTYQLVTYEYKHDKDVDKLVEQTIIVATYMGDGPGSGQSFMMSKMPSTKGLDEGSNMYNFMKEREEELATAVSDFTASWETLSGKAKFDAATGYTFDEFNKDKKHYTAHRQNTTGHKPGSAGFKRKLPSARKMDAYGTLGSVYVSIDITSAVKSGKLLGPNMSGAILTASKEIKEILSEVDSETGVPTITDRNGDAAFEEASLESYGLGKAGAKPKSSKQFSKKMEDLEELGSIKASTIAEFDEFVAGDVKKPYKFTRGRGATKETFYVMLMKGMRNTTIPFVYDGGTWIPFFGIDAKGEFIVDKNVEEEEDYYIEPVEKMTEAMGGLDTSEASLDSISVDINRVDLQKILSAVMNYDIDKVENAKTMSSKFSLASSYALKDAYQMLGDMPITMAQFKALVKRQYRGMEVQPFSISRPLLFTQGPHKGRAFILYTFRKGKEHDLSTFDGIKNVMDGLKDFAKDRVRGKKGYDADNMIDHLAQRNGVGVILLDAPGKTFTELAESIPSLVDKNGITDFNRSSVPLNSKTSHRLRSMTMELYWAFGAPPGMGGHVAGPTHKFIKYNAEKNKRVTSYMWDPKTKKIKLDPSERTLDPAKLKIFVERVTEMLSDKNPNKAERAAAMKFLSILADINKDENMGMFRVKDAPRGTTTKNKAVSVGKKLKNIVMRGENNDIPSIIPDSRSAITYYPKELSVQPDGSFAIPNDMTGFNLAAFLRLLMQPSIQKGDKPPYFFTQEENSLTVGLFDQVLDETLNPGTLQKGIFVTPALVKNEGHKSFWGTARMSPELEHELSTTAKGLNTPGLTFNIEFLSHSIKKKTVSIKDQTLLKKEYSTKAKELYDKVHEQILAAAAAKTGYSNSDVITKEHVQDGFQDIFETDLKGFKATILNYRVEGKHHAATVKITGTDAEGNPVITTVEVKLNPPESIPEVNPVERINDLEALFYEQLNTLGNKDFKDVSQKARDQISKAYIALIKKVADRQRGGHMKRPGDVNMDEVASGKYKLSIDGMTEAQKDRANTFSKILPIIVTEKQRKKLKRDLDKFKGELTPPLDVEFFKIYKPLLTRLSTEADSILTVDYIEQLRKKFEDEELDIPKYADTNGILTSIADFDYEVGTQDKGNLIHAYVTASTEEKLELESVVEATLADPTSDAYMENPYVLARSILHAYDNTDHSIDDIKNMDAYQKLKADHPAELKAFLAKHPLPASKPPVITSPSKYEDFSTEVKIVMGDANLDKEQKVKGLLIIKNTKSANGNLTPGEKIALAQEIDEQLNRLNMTESTTSIVEKHLNAQNDINKTSDLNAIYKNMSTIVETEMAHHEGYSLFIGALKGKSYADGSEESRKHMTFLNDLYDVLENADSVKDKNDIGGYVNLLTDISSCT